MDNRTKIIVFIGMILFIILAAGVSYGYLTYNKDLANVSLTTGDISISLSNINGNLNLINVIPKSDSEGIKSTDYLDFTVDATVDMEKIYYEVYILPKSNNTLNTSYLKTYLTDQTNNPMTAITTYNNLINSQSGNGKTVYYGVINLNNDYSPRNETENFRLRLWLDEDYPELTSKAFSFDVYLYAKNVAENYS